MNKEIIPAAKVQEIEKDAKSFERKLKTLEIKNDKDMSDAIDIMGQMSAREKRLEDMRKSIVQPLNVQVKAINDMFKKMSAPFTEMKQTVKDAISRFRTKQEAERRTLEDRMRREAEEAAAEEARKKHQSVKATIENVSVPVVAAAPNAIAGKDHAAQFRHIKDYRVLDEKKIPDEYWILNDRAIRDAMRNDTEIPGVEYFEKEIIASR